MEFRSPRAAPARRPAPGAPLPGVAAWPCACRPTMPPLLGDDIDTARAWRMSVRRAFLHYFPLGYLVSAFVADGEHDAAYLLTRPA